MVRTVKLPYTTTPQGARLIADWRKAQSVVLRTAYNRVREGMPDKDILDLLRGRPQGKLDSWLTLSALKRARAIHRAQPGKKVIFGGRHNFELRSQGKITAAQWQAKRLLPLYFEGHARSYGEQGGNHRFVLDISSKRILFYPRAKLWFELKLKLGNSNYRQALEDLEFRCVCHRDVPFTVSLTQTHISIMWEEKTQTVKLPLREDRVLALDLNPNRIGLSVLEKSSAGCKVLHWSIYDYPELNTKLKLAADHTQSIHQRNKRVFELSQIAKAVEKAAVHYQCGTVASEYLNIETKDHKKGKSFNRAVNNQWTRRGFILPLVRRMEKCGIRHVELNPAYSSKMGNWLWGWKAMIPDPACAAVELGRRFLEEDPKQWACKDGANRRKEERQAQAGGVQTPDAQARDHWKRVWNQLTPKPGDTPRLTIPVLKEKFPELCPSQSPFHAPQSLVARLEPARICQKLRIHLRTYL